MKKAIAALGLSGALVTPAYAEVLDENNNKIHDALEVQIEVGSYTPYVQLPAKEQSPKLAWIRISYNSPTTEQDFQEIKDLTGVVDAEFTSPGLMDIEIGLPPHLIHQFAEDNYDRIKFIEGVGLYGPRS